MAARFRLGSVLFNLFLPSSTSRTAIGKISSDPISNGAHSTKDAQHGFSAVGNTTKEHSGETLNVQARSSMWIILGTSVFTDLNSEATTLLLKRKRVEGGGGLSRQGHGHIPAQCRLFR